LEGSVTKEFKDFAIFVTFAYECVRTVTAAIVALLGNYRGDFVSDCITIQYNITTPKSRALNIIFYERIAGNKGLAPFYISVIPI
jgi:hypothetical protein